jgi:hypothetical protein
VDVDDHSDRGGTALEADSRGVAQELEPLSPGSRSRVSEVSASYRSHGVNHEPESHKTRHDFDTRATQNHEKRRQVLRVPIMTLTCNDASF